MNALLLGMVVALFAQVDEGEPLELQVNRTIDLAAAKLLVDPTALEYHFGPEFAGGGYFTVIVQFENRGEGSFEIERTDFAVILENGDRFEPIPPLEVLTAIRRSALNATSVLLAPFIFPPILVYKNTRDYNFEMARSFYEKAFPSHLRLEPEDPHLSRAFFFHDPRGETRTEEDFDSSVLQFLAEVEGTPTSPAAESTPEEPEHRVGKRVTFTISLTREGL